MQRVRRRGETSLQRAQVTDSPAVAPRKQPRRQRLWTVAGTLALAVVLALSLVSVAGSSKLNHSTGATSPAELVGQPSTQRGGELKALMAFDCGTWDPTVSAFTQGCLDVQRLFLRQLVTFSPGRGPTRLVPDLARAVPTSADQRTWRYELKPGLRWEDGRPITSYDVKYGIERAFAPELGTSGLFVKNELVGADSYPGPYRDKAGLTSIETPDPQTVVFHLSSPFPDWNYVMAEPYASPVPQARDTGANYGSRPIASGPYKFAGYQPGHLLSLVRNQNWVWSSDPARAALPDRIEIRFAIADNEQERLIASNAADLQIKGTGLSAADQVRSSHDPVLQQRLHVVDSANTVFLALSTAVKPLDNVHCRRAVAWAVDREELQQAGELGTGPAATRMLPPSLRSGGRPVDVDLSSRPHGDLARARQELAACGMPNGFQTNLAYFGNQLNTVRRLSNMLSAVGIILTPKLTNAYQEPGFVRAQQLGIALTNWTGDWPSPYAFFAPLVDAKLITPFGNANTAEIRDQLIQNDLAAGTSSTTSNARALAWSQLDEGVLKDAYYVPLTYSQPAVLTSARLTNVYTTEFFGDIDLTAVGVVP